MGKKRAGMIQCRLHVIL